MNIRESFDWKEPYHMINREERNVCAILYHLLLVNNNTLSFLEFLNKPDYLETESSIFFEYSQLRDIWYNFKNNEIKRNYILNSLGYSQNHWLRSCPRCDFNQYFGVGNKPSKEYIQSPSNWAMSHYDNTIENNDEFLNATKFKWCFNAKPDIVIHFGTEKAICIEAKFESGIGTYPSTDTDKSIFSKRKLDYESQTDTQVKIFDLLGIQADFYILSKKKSKNNKQNCKTHKSITWKEVFSILDTSNVPEYIQNWILRF
ncbi:hypothetical protein [Candidatus Albibeggiatoa sp. nov. NOAA]|uniref:hypothetical protein n=1 Tax=Candidatus Albibeggiatoa sp. nov. NOAA TaxID=3162724 RepID=UPI003301D7AC|nr:hypothetical protein [Thiotrichaceae bacterium]